MRLAVGVVLGSVVTEGLLTFKERCEGKDTLF